MKHDRVYDECIYRMGHCSLVNSRCIKRDILFIVKSKKGRCINSKTIDSFVQAWIS